MSDDNKTLEQLTALLKTAEEIKARSQTDNNLAEQLRKAANNYYGAECRSTEFIQALYLAGEIQEKIEKVWTKKYYIIAEGSLPKKENSLFKFESYTAGKAELTLDGEVKRSLYGLGLCTGVELRFGNTYVEYDQLIGNKHTKKKMADDLGQMLRRKILSNLPIDKKNNFFVLIGEPFSCQETMVPFGIKGDEVGQFEINFTNNEQLYLSFEENTTRLSLHLNQLYREVRSAGFENNNWKKYGK